MISRKKKFVLAFITVLFGLAAGLLVAEIYLRIATPEWLSKEMNELNLARNVEAFGSTAGWKVEKIDGTFVRFVPNTEFRVRYYEYDHQVHIDALGDRAVAHNPNPRAQVIPFLGDSFPFGIGVKDEETFVSLLSARSQFQFLNLGVPGSALPTQLNQIEFRHRELHSAPIYVFGFYTGNDFMDIFNYHGKLAPEQASGGEKKTTAEFVEWAELHIYRNRILSKSFLLQFVKRTVFRQYFFATQTRRAILPHECLATKKGLKPITNSALLIMAGNKGCIDEVDSLVKQTLDHLMELSMRLHFQPFFIIIPERLQMNPEILRTRIARWQLDLTDLDMQCPNRIIEDELKSHGIPFIDVSECLQGKEDAYYEIDGHFTPLGHRIVAQYLLPKINVAITRMMASK